MRRAASTLSALTAACLVGGCLEPSNPCDPESDDALRGTSTLSGVVKDQAGAPLAGVTVTLPGHPSPAISGEDGAFRFEGLLPNAGPQGYEVIALVDEPRVGGRALAPPLGCEDDVGGVELLVAVPPPSPEVEIVQATAPDRLFVAFAAAEGSTRYTVEVRAPFETWQPAALSRAPVPEPAGDALARAQLYDAVRAPTLDDDEARAFCDAFAYVLTPLAHENARCTEVVGTRVGNTLLPLREHGSYEVRVRAELVLDAGMVTEQRLPEVVRSAPTSVPGELSLVPTAVLPVMLDPDEETHREKLRALDIDAMVPVSHRRFAMLGEGTSAEGLLIVGHAAVASPGVYDGSAAAPDDALAFDDDSPGAAAEVTADEGTGLAILPAGRWVRVWKRAMDPDTATMRSEVEKVFIGTESRAEEHGEQTEPTFAFDLDSAGLASELRAFSWLVQPEGTVGGEGPYSPDDGYLLLLRGGFVLLEHEEGGDGTSHLGALADGFVAGAAGTLYGETDANRQNAMTTGHCEKLGAAALGADGVLGERTIRVCFDLEGALGETLALTDVAILRAHEDATSPDDTFHVMSDAAGDRVLVVSSRALLGQGGDPLLDHLDDVGTGVAPASLAQSRLLDCEEGSADPVVLVANRGSLDVSVLAVVGEGQGARVEEVGVVPVPGVPVRFFDDPDGPACVDPFTWVVLDDGRSIPLDMRARRLGVPACGDEACAVRTSDRAPVGAVSRGALGKSRVLVGGRGLLGEVGYLRPSASAATAVGDDEAADGE